MRGFVFTLDAVFSLVFAAFAVAALAYISYSSYNPPSIQAVQVSSVGQTLMSTSLQQLGQLSPLYSAGSAETWPQYGSDEGFGFGNPYGPTAPYLLYTYNVPANILPAPAASYGYLAFAAGNQLYELNATTGLLVGNYPLTNPNAISAGPAFYRNYLLYANSTGWIDAVSAATGNLVWKTNVGYAKLTTPLDLEDGYVVVAGSSSSGWGGIYLINPSNGIVAQSYQTSVNGNGANVLWIAHHKGAFYLGVGSGKTFNEIINQEFVNASLYPSNSFASYGNFARIQSANTVAMYGNLTTSYSRSLGLLNLTSVPDYPYASFSDFGLPAANFNTTPSIGGNYTYLLYNGINLYAFSKLGQLFNVTLPNKAAPYNYSDIALAYGNAYVANGNTIYAFGPGTLQRNMSALAALGSLYLEGRGGIADYLLYGLYGSSDIGMFINGSYAAGLHVANFSGINNYLSVPAVSKLSPEAGSAGAMSLCGWYKINGNIIAYNGLLVKGNWAPSSGVPEFAVDPVISGSVVRGFAVYNALGNIAASYNVPSPLAQNSVGYWSSFCFSYNASSSSAFYYLNGTQYTGTVNSANIPASSGTGALVIGAGENGYSNVSVANIQLYSTAISASRVGGIYVSGLYGRPANTTGLVGWWPLLGDGNDYSGDGLVGFPNNVVYNSANYIPASLSRSVGVAGAGNPVQLFRNWTSNVYNVSVVVWSS
jgi:hypothetical protein